MLTQQPYHVIIIAAGMSRRLAALTQEKPKSFLEINNKKLIDYHFDILYANGIRELTLVVGYLRDLFFRVMGTRYRNINISYVVSEEYENTGHSWSVSLTRETWKHQPRPVLLIHADVFYDPFFLAQVLASPQESVILVDNHFKVMTGDECIVHGQQGQVHSLLFDAKKNPDTIIGEFVGISKWSSEFMQGFYSYLLDFFSRCGRTAGYEVVLNEYLQQKKAPLWYAKTEGRSWMNINYKEDYEKAREELYPRIYRGF